MKGQVIIAAVVLVLVPSARASQQPADANDLRTLGDYLRYAALNNAGLKAQFEQWKAAIEQVPQAGVLPDPRFTYGYFIREVETRVAQLCAVLNRKSSGPLPWPAREEYSPVEIDRRQKLAELEMLVGGETSDLGRANENE